MLPPIAAIFIELCPLVIEMQVPALKVAANGVPALDPMTICPAVKFNAVKALPDNAPVVSKEGLPVLPPATTAVPYWLARDALTDERNSARGA
jgi:hypothetical protein